MPKTSPLYNLITELKDENHNLADLFMLINNASRNYFLFKLSRKVNSILGENYNLEEAHFSIDKEYSYNQHGYTPIHYTQSYISETKNQYVIIHGFLNAKGEYLYSQAKVLNKDKIFTGTYVDLTAEQETILQNQIKQFTPLLEPLFTEKKAREFELKKQSNTLDWELTSLSHDLSSVQAHEEYISKAHEFITTVQKLNRYSETNDGRDLLMLNMIQQIKKIYICMKRQSKDKTITIEPIEETFENKAEIVEPHESIEELYTNAMSIFSKNIKDFQDCNLDLLERKHQLASNLHEQLLVIYYFSENLILKKDKQKIKKAVDNINTFYTEQVNRLTQEALKGNIQTVQQLFPVCSRYITTDFYEKLVNSLVEKKWNSVQANILTICDYLSEQDDRYKNYIWHLSQEKEFLIPRHSIIDSIKTKLFNIEKIEHDTSNYQASLLCQLYLKDKKNLFEAFLRHGASCNTWGIKSCKKNTFRFALFYTISITEIGNYLDYLKILLDFQADSNFIFTKEETTNYNIKKLKNAIEEIKSSKKNPEPKVKTQRFIPAIKIISIINNIESEHLAFFKNILEKSSLHNLAFSLTQFYQHSLTRRRLGSGKDFALYYVNNQDQAQTKIKEIAQNQSNNDCFPFYIFYPEFGSTPEQIQTLQGIYKKMKLIEEHISKKLSILNLQKFEEQYNIAFRIALDEFLRVQHLKLENQYQTGFDYFLGCEYLLMRYAQLSNPSTDQRSFVQKHSKYLYDEIIKVIKKMCTQQQAEHRIGFYGQIRESFAKRHIVSDAPLRIITYFENVPNLENQIMFCKKPFLINHYNCVPNYTESDFNQSKIKLKRN